MPSEEIKTPDGIIQRSWGDTHSGHTAAEQALSMPQPPRLKTPIPPGVAEASRKAVEARVAAAKLSLKMAAGKTVEQAQTELQEEIDAETEKYGLEEGEGGADEIGDAQVQE